MSLNNTDLSELHAATASGGYPAILIAALNKPKFELNECEVLDFKRQLPETSPEYVKTLRDIIALHNSYGGFIVFGVEETTRDRAFEIIGVGKCTLDKARLRDLVRGYTGIDVRLDVTPIDAGDVQLEIVWVAKRLSRDPPVRFAKNGPDDKDGKPAFKKGDVVFRRLDANGIATAASDYDFLFSERHPPSLVPSMEYGAQSQRLEHNLPDRAEICATFVGRSEDQADLWRWLADDFSRVRLIAGEGGLGKTSLAYTFAEHVASRPVRPLNKVVWLSAKETQFVASQDKYRATGRIDFNDAETLFKAISISLGQTPEECSELDGQDLMRMALRCCEVLPSFIVIDDVDSMPPADQLRALEFGMRAPVGTKILLTTRVNFSYSPDNVLKLDGFQADEFRDYVSVLRKRYQMTQLDEGRIEAIRREVGGSPLFADSLLRLERRGLPLDQALARWKGERGLEVRKAALDREIQQLTRPARRALYVVSTLRSCSYIELSQVLDYTEQTLGDALQELSGLFLIDAPSIAKEARFTVEPTTRLLVLETATTLHIDHSALVKAIKASKNDAIGLGLQKRSSIVALAISQANASIRAGDSKGALEVVMSALKSLKQPHPDLLLAIGRFRLALNPPDYEGARNAFEDAFARGQRKTLLFDMWFDAEYKRGSLDSARDIASMVINGESSDQMRWFERRGQVHVALAFRADSKVSNDAKLRELNLAIDDFKEAKKVAGDTANGGRLDQILSQALSFRASLFRRENVAHKRIL